MDKNAGKYDKIYKKEFELAANILANDGGLLEWSMHDYQAFTYKGDGVSLVFYPHKTSALNYHLRVRDNGSKNKAKANRLMKKLDDGTGYNCTFTKKAS
jgi:hypothetical protein